MGHALDAWTITKSLPPPWGAGAVPPNKPSHPINSVTLPKAQTELSQPAVHKHKQLGRLVGKRFGKDLIRPMRIALACIAQTSYLIELNNACLAVSVRTQL